MPIDSSRQRYVILRSSKKSNLGRKNPTTWKAHDAPQTVCLYPFETTIATGKRLKIGKKQAMKIGLLTPLCGPPETWRDVYWKLPYRYFLTSILKIVTSKKISNRPIHDFRKPPHPTTNTPWSFSFWNMTLSLVVGIKKCRTVLEQALRNMDQDFPTVYL